MLLSGVRMRNAENSPFVSVFDSEPFRPGVKTSERGGEKAKAKMDSGFRRNDGQNPKPGGGAGVTSSSMDFSTAVLQCRFAGLIHKGDAFIFVRVTRMKL